MIGTITQAMVLLGIISWYSRGMILLINDYYRSEFQKVMNRSARIPNDTVEDMKYSHNDDQVSEGNRGGGDNSEYRKDISSKCVLNPYYEFDGDFCARQTDLRRFFNILGLPHKTRQIIVDFDHENAIAPNRKILTEENK